MVGVYQLSISNFILNTKKSPDVESLLSTTHPVLEKSIIFIRHYVCLVKPFSMFSLIRFISQMKIVLKKKCCRFESYKSIRMLLSIKY